MPRLTLPDGTEIAYVTRGQGERPLLLVHGHLASKEWWEPTLTALPAACTAYALDLPGSGESPETGRRHTIDYFAEVVAAFARAVGVTRAAVVGHSMGGGVAQMLALEHPALVERLVLLDAMAADGFHVLFFQGPTLARRLMAQPALLARALRRSCRAVRTRRSWSVSSRRRHARPSKCSSSSR
ncbi:MAG: alpha/beta fold hydrolase [Polyangiaceae bacterium]